MSQYISEYPNVSWGIIVYITKNSTFSGRNPVQVENYSSAEDETCIVTKERVIFEFDATFITSQFTGKQLSYTGTIRWTSHHINNSYQLARGFEWKISWKIFN